MGLYIIGLAAPSLLVLVLFCISIEAHRVQQNERKQRRATYKLLDDFEAERRFNEQLAERRIAALSPPDVRGKLHQFEERLK